MVNGPSAPQRPPWLIAGLVVCFLGMGAAIISPVYQSAKVAATSAAAITNAKQVDLGVIMYTNDYDDHFPPAFSKAWIDTKLSHYLSRPPDELVTIAEEYSWDNRLAGASIDQLPDPAKAWMFCGPIKDPNHRHVIGYADGSAKPVPDDRLAEATEPIVLDETNDEKPSRVPPKDIHKVWQLDSGASGEGVLQVSLVEHARYTLIDLEPIAKDGTQLIHVVTGSYEFANGKLTMQRAIRVKHWSRKGKAGKWVDVTERDQKAEPGQLDQEANSMTLMDTDALASGKVVTGAQVLEAPFDVLNLP